MLLRQQLSCDGAAAFKVYSCIISPPRSASLRLAPPPPRLVPRGIARQPRGRRWNEGGKERRKEGARSLRGQGRAGRSNLLQPFDLLRWHQVDQRAIVIRHDGGDGAAAVEATIFAPCGAVSGDVCSLVATTTEPAPACDVGGWRSVARSLVCPSVLPLVAYDFLIPPTRRPSGFRPGAHALRRASGVGGQGMLTQNECFLGWRARGECVRAEPLFCR